MPQFTATGTGPTGTIQEWIVPTTADWIMEVAGAQGGEAASNCCGGLGAIMRGIVPLTAGQKIFVLVGQMGQARSHTAGGGGGSFVATGDTVATADPLMVAGGGAGSGNTGGTGRPGVVGTAGAPASGYGGGAGVSGTNGNGGSGSNGGWGESGAGFYTDSTSPKSTWGTTRDANSILAFRNGGIGAAPWPANNGSCVSAGGGFGGGGGGACNGGGGGGGYSGGGGGGCGGGSFSVATDQNNETGANEGHGWVKIYQPTVVSGVVYDKTGEPCQRAVYAMTRPTNGDAPVLLAHGLSDPVTGAYELAVNVSDDVTRIVVSEDDDNPLLNDLVDRVIPGVA